MTNNTEEMNAREMAKRLAAIEDRQKRLEAMLSDPVEVARHLHELLAREQARRPV